VSARIGDYSDRLGKQEIMLMIVIELCAYIEAAEKLVSQQGVGRKMMATPTHTKFLHKRMIYENAFYKWNRF